MSRTKPFFINACFLAATLAAAGCAGKGRHQAFEPPADADPVVRARLIAKAEALSRDAQRYELAGKEEQAIATYRQAIATYSEIPVAWHNLGVLLAKQGRNLEAAEAYKTASELAPTEPVSLYNIGVLWEDLGYLDDAARWYDEALGRDPNYLPALRRSVLVDDLRNKLSQTTAERLKAAILMEREPWWINRFKRIQQRMNELDGKYFVPTRSGEPPIPPGSESGLLQVPDTGRDARPPQQPQPQVPPPQPAPLLQPQPGAPVSPAPPPPSDPDEPPLSPAEPFPSS